MLKKNAAQMVKKIKDLETQPDSLNKQMEKEDNLQEQIDEPLSKNLYLESYSRRENVKTAHNRQAFPFKQLSIQQPLDS